MLDAARQARRGRSRAPTDPRRRAGRLRPRRRCVAPAGDRRRTRPPLLLDAVGSDLRELAQAAAQLVSDSGGRVERRHGARLPPRPGRGERLRGLRPRRRRRRGPARSRRCGGRCPSACRTSSSPMRWPTGFARWPGCRAAGRGNPYQLAQAARHAAVEGQARPVAGPGLDRGRAARTPCRSSPTLNADVKGAAVDPEYALERAVLRLAQARAALTTGSSR